MAPIKCKFRNDWLSKKDANLHTVSEWAKANPKNPHSYKCIRFPAIVNASSGFIRDNATL